MKVCCGKAPPRFGDRFGDDFYVEVMPHNQPGMNKALVELADEGGYS